MKGFEIKFNIYAESEEEVEKAKEAIVSFISENAKEGRAVTASKISSIVPLWRNNIFIRNRIIDYLNGK